MLKNDIPCLGVRFLTPGTLRHHLLSVYQHSKALELRENLHLLMKVAAKSLDNNPVARAAEIEPEQFVRLADILETTGWDTNAIKNFHAKILIEKYLEQQNHYALATVQRATNLLYKESAICPRLAFSDLVVFGFRSRHWADYKMLLAAIRSSENATACLLTQDSTQLIDQAWLGSWEQELGPSERSHFTSEEKPFSYLSYYFEDISSERSEEQADQLPEIYISEDILREAEVIVAKVAQSIATEKTLRLGVVFANQTSPLAREVSRLLEEEEISHHNHLGYLSGKDSRQRLFESWINWQRKNRLQDFLAFLDELATEELLTFDQVISFDKYSRQALQNILSSDLGAIWAYLRCTRSDSSVMVLLNQWPLLPEEASINEFITISRSALEIIAWLEDIKTIEQRAGFLLLNLKNPISKNDFLTWFSSIIKPLGRTAKDFGKNPYALVHLISEEEAILQSWSHLILAGLNQGEWPKERNSIIFLDEKEISKLNENSLKQGNQGEGHLAIKSGLTLFPSKHDQYSIHKNNFRTLLGAASKKLILTAHLKEPEQSNDALISEFLEKTYWISEGTLLDTELIRSIYKNTTSWIQFYRSQKHATLPPIERIVCSYNKRRDTEKPFDEFSFCFKNPNKQAFELSSKVWEAILTAPEYAWFNHILGAKRKELPLGKSLYALAKGTWVHSWLKFDDQYSAKKIGADEWSQKINAHADEVFRTIEKSFTQLSRPLPEIWKAIWDESRRTAIALAKSLSVLAENFYLFSEHAIPESNNGSTNIIDPPLKGRVDLMAYPTNNLNEKNHPLLIIDFKTGSSSALTQNRLKKGIGLQLALYALAFKVDGFNDIKLSIIKPNSIFTEQIHVNEVLECKPLLNTINLIYQTGKLGIHESMSKAYGSGFIFPLSTLKIEDDVIEKKWNLTHPGLSSETQ